MEKGMVVCTFAHFYIEIDKYRKKDRFIPFIYYKKLANGSHLQSTFFPPFTHLFAHFSGKKHTGL